MIYIVYTYNKDGHHTETMLKAMLVWVCVIKAQFHNNLIWLKFNFSISSISGTLIHISDTGMLKQNI